MALRTRPTLYCCDDYENNKHTSGYSISLSENGVLYCMGSEAYGVTISSPLPSRIAKLENIKEISCGAKHLICLDFSGKVFTVDNKPFGVLGVGSSRIKIPSIPQHIELPPVKQVSAGSYFNVCVTEDGFVYSFGNSDFYQLGHGDKVSHGKPKKIESLKDVEFVECGALHTLCKCYNGDVYAWGSNSHGQLGEVYLDDQCSPSIKRLAKRHS